jgi:glyoxylase-like metal-dependent hydrolase (beta-lactamase superfamily II)
MKYQIRKHSDRLSQILLSPPIDGFDDFISVWVYRGEETFIVETGPSSTSGALLSALGEIGLTSPDYILLTHIHIDHAGGIGEIAAAFPGTPVVCHDMARPHLIDPEKLWQGTVKTLGDTGRAYGPIKPVPEERLLSPRHFSAGSVKAILTPGHAPHHVSFITADGLLFAGEAGGVCIDFHDTIDYLRPATPPKFRLETSAASIDLLVAENPEHLCYGHTAMRTGAAARLKTHREQLFFWKEMIAGEIGKAEGEILIQKCVDRVMKDDPLLRGLSFTTEAAGRREDFFIRNSIRGYIDYLAPAP